MTAALLSSQGVAGSIDALDCTRKGPAVLEWKRICIVPATGTDMFWICGGVSAAEAAGLMIDTRKAAARARSRDAFIALRRETFHARADCRNARADLHRERHSFPRDRKPTSNGGTTWLL